jgi:hypothetical protein
VAPIGERASIADALLVFVVGFEPSDGL